ncbi:MAG: ECF transporter S component [candidate division GAL15 bacterium]
MRTRDLTAGALATALVAATTMVIRIPVPATQGYINLGETAVYLAALLLGPVHGLVAGGVGSALADLWGGYAQFAPFTLVIKGVEGWLAGYLFWRVLGGAGFLQGGWAVRAAVACGAAGAWMVGGYYVAEAFLLGLGPAAAAEVPGNVFQVLAGVLVALAGASLLRGVVAPR